ncbi:MAG: hypothetical protein GWN67_25485 [Phycisphaerae bacterium]|nr:hypothetical protein [Candidatus Saccharibacteria bacterium]NIS54190.1 hypothetical protein [Phycisphaerae bacterium]NIT56206.1 hypothetical protein [Fodinibius sp.]NIU11793.1 hypothetical protein [Phycisphaerae bacterium]NIU59616.1 hypothetical protein [Phycisphaerae bacterium]
MKKILLALVVLVFATPALADVNITATQVGETNEVIISFDATSETNLVRAFGLDITLDNDVNIISVTGLSSDYWVYPGTIQIDAQGNITYAGTIVAEVGDLPGDTLPGPPDGNGVTLECASLYAPVGPGSPNAPAKSGDICSIIVSDDTCLSISANVSRAGPTGVVMENPDEVVTVNYPASCIVIDVNIPDDECMKDTAPEYPEWEAWGKPLCWCYSRQCRGDADGIKTGPFWVAIPDLNMFRAAFNKSDLVLQGVTNGICSDADHIKTGPFRVAIPDLNIFRAYFNKPELSVPVCDPANYNWWETP